MIILDIVLMVLIASAIVGLLTWSVFTQYRHHGCAHLRIRRPQITVKLSSSREVEPIAREVEPVAGATVLRAS